MITITSCGHDSHHPKPCNIEYNNSVSDYLLLLVKKEAWFYINENKIETKPNMIICFPPNSHIHYGCDISGYNDDWIHFSLNENDKEFFDGLNIPLYNILYPSDFHKLSQYVSMISDVFHNKSEHYQNIIDSFMRTLFYSIADDLSPKNSDSLSGIHYVALSHLRTQIYNNPSSTWIIEDIASSVCLSTSYFQHLYKQYFGCSCQQDIINSRLNLAKLYLTTTNMQISDIADFCGYNNELHFMRQFKKFIGITPSNYRHSSKNNL